MQFLLGPELCERENYPFKHKSNVVILAIFSINIYIFTACQSISLVLVIHTYFLTESHDTLHRIVIRCQRSVSAENVSYFLALYHIIRFMFSNYRVAAFYFRYKLQRLARKLLLSNHKSKMSILHCLV